VLGIHVTSGYFALFGAPIVAGRTFTAAEDSPNGGHVVGVIGHDFVTDTPADLWIPFHFDLTSREMAHNEQGRKNRRQDLALPKFNQLMRRQLTGTRRSAS
jgi:hypothetical protein